MEQGKLDNTILALLFASDEPLSTTRISSVVDEMPITDIRASLERIETQFDGEDSPIRLERIGGGYQLSTNTRYAEYVARLYRGRRKQRLSKAAMETLAIIAYKQPVTRADMESIRGVGCGGVIMTLIERSLIRIVGKAKVLGSPFLYGTTQEFLEYLGLDRLKDLPSLEDLEALLQKEAASEPTDVIEPGEHHEDTFETSSGDAWDADGTESVEGTKTDDDGVSIDADSPKHLGTEATEEDNRFDEPKQD